jgi:hypothetical protein
MLVVLLSSRYRGVNSAVSLAIIGARAQKI